MQRLLMILLALVIAGCMPQKARKAVTGDPHAKNLSPGCYTVDLFDPYFIQYPDESVPTEVRQYLGVWRQGAWGGKWCHDLYVTAAYADGTVDVLDLYGPLPGTPVEATVFKRKGRVVNGELQLSSIGFATTTYRREGEYLLGLRDGVHGKFDVTMVREERLAEVPIPPVNPRRRRS
ncbi:MAG: hypothetical protein AAF479_13165 [Pseudomonadota bacterium]